MTTSTPSKKTAGENERFTAALSYVWILSLYTLFFHRESSFIRFHSKQGVALFVIESLSFLALIFSPLVIIVCVIASIWGIKEALAGKYWTLPYVGEWIKTKNI